MRWLRHAHPAVLQVSYNANHLYAEVAVVRRRGADGTVQVRGAQPHIAQRGHGTKQNRMLNVLSAAATAQRQQRINSVYVYV